MSAHDNDGPTFPAQSAAEWQAHGMSLRDSFAMLSLNVIGTLIAHGLHTAQQFGTNSAEASIARDAYRLADAMLAERAKQPAAAPAPLPPAYMLAKLQMVMPLFQEARDALTVISEAQRKLHRIAPDLADRMDAAGTYSLDDWTTATQAKEPGHE